MPRVVVSSLAVAVALVAGACVDGTGTGAVAVTQDAPAVLESLRSRCESGEATMCDLLYMVADSDDLRAIADSCGGRNDPAGWCADIYGADVDPADLRAECGSGDVVACDLLFMYSPIGSADEAYGGRCGGLGSDGRMCVVEHGLP